MIAHIRNAFLRRLLIVLVVPVYPVLCLGVAACEFWAELRTLPAAAASAWRGHQH